MKKNSNLKHLLLAIDTGASAIKVVASIAGEEKCYPFTITNDWVDLSTLHESDRIPEPNPDFNENSVWVGIGTKFYAIGILAKVRYNTYSSIKPLKNDSIVPKIVAALAVAHKKFNLPPKFEVSICSVLPPGEYVYSKGVFAKLTLALRVLQTPDKKIFPSLKKITIKPEGYGILNWHRIYGAATNQDIGVIMFGYRNTSVLFSVSGQLSDLKSCDRGFCQVLDKISSLSGGGYNDDELSQPVWDYLIHNDETGFRRISRSVTDYQLELSMIKTAIDKAMTDYRLSLQNWLLSAMQQTDMIVLCGGNAEYIGDSFDDFLQNYAKHIEGRGYMIQHHIGATAIPEEISNTKMAVRYLDIYCLWLELSRNNPQ